MVELFAILAFQLVFEPTICGFMIFVTTYSAFLLLPFLPSIFFVTFTNEGLYTLLGMYSLLYTAGSESVAMFGSFGLFAVWCFTVWKSHLALQRESKVLLLGFLMEFSSYNLNQLLWRYAHFKMEIPLQHFLSF